MSVHTAVHQRALAEFVEIDKVESENLNETIKLSL